MTTIRENAVILESSDIVSAAYIPGSLMVTLGQPFADTLAVDVTDGIVSIVCRAGRKKTKAVAHSFAKDVGGMGHAYAPQGGDGGLPKELNFYFGLNLTFSGGETSTVFVGQGSNFPRNNWWIGSPQISGQKLEVGKGYTLGGADLQKELGDLADTVLDNVPLKYRPAARLFGMPLFKQLFGTVNVITIK